MQVTVDRCEGYAILRLEGEFDSADPEGFFGRITDLSESGVKHVALDMSRVSFINSKAVGALLKAAKTLRVQDGRLVVSQPSAFCRDILERLGFDRQVQVFDNDEAAGEFLGEGTS